MFKLQKSILRCSKFLKFPPAIKVTRQMSTPPYDPNLVRNVAIIAHVGMLYHFMNIYDSYFTSTSI